MKTQRIDGLALGAIFCAASWGGAVTAAAETARPLPLSDVRLTGGPLQHAQQLDAEYLLKLDPDRMLYFLRQRAGLPAKTKEGNGGWDNGGRALTGHIAGHYLSAVSLMYAATGDARFKERADYLVAQLQEVQDKQGDGYIGALADAKGNDGKKLFAQIGAGDIRSGFDLNGMWSPWYVQHKLFAGLRDAYRLTGNRKALEVETRFAAWAESVVGKLDDAQTQKMLAAEFGGMNEVFADLYADTGDRRWLDLSDRFEHRAVLDPLKRGEDRLAGLHANTQIPKLVGSMARYAAEGRPEDLTAARFFWETVVYHHSFATGSHSKDEYFDEADQLDHHLDGRTAESCNVYNMLKLTRKLFAAQPDGRYADFLERALFNHILASQDPQDGRVCYMVPVGRGVTHEYQDMFRDWTCCVGTGMESHALHGDGIYYESGDKLWVNLYAPSVAEWKTVGARLEMQTDFPEGQSAKLIVHVKTPTRFTAALRRPAWAGNGFAVAVNGEPVDTLPASDQYAELTREWRDGDTVTLALPKTLRAEPVPDNLHRVALMWGPLALAGDLGPEDSPERPGGSPAEVPVFVTADQKVADWLKPVADQPGAKFRTDNVGRPREVDFVPFYRLHRRAYAVYWDVLTPAEWETRAKEIAAEQERQRKLEMATVAFVQPGQMQSERDFNEQGEDSDPDRVMGRAARRGKKWFSFDLPVDPAHPMALVVTYYSDEWRKRTFEILVDGKRVGEQTVEKGGDPRFFDMEYALPADAVRDKKKVTVRFQATGGNEIAAVFGVRVVRGNAAR